MNIKNIFAAAALAFAAFAPAQAQQAGALNLKDLMNGAYYAEGVSGVRPASEGSTYTQISPDRRQIVRRNFSDGKQAEVVFDIASVEGANFNAVEGYILSPDGNRILLQTRTRSIYRRSFTAEYYIYTKGSRKLEPLSENGPQQAPIFSPDGTMVAFARDNDLYIVKLLFGNAESRVTTDGKRNAVLNGIPDWVNEEEFSTARSFCFTADSKMLAWIRYDESQVPVYHIQMYKGLAPEEKQNAEYPGSYDYKYPVAGARNADVCVKTYDIQSRATRTMDVPLDSDGYIPRIQATNDADKLAVVTLNRHQDRMDIYMVNPRSTVAKLALREESDKYVKETAYTQLTFYPGCFVVTSDRTGYNHLYLYSLNGQLLRTLTSGDFEVTAFYGYDAKTGNVYYQSTQESPLRRSVYVADKKGKVTRLSTETGTNSATFSSDFRYFMNVYSSTQQPPVTTLRDQRGKTTATLVDNARLKERTAPLQGKQEFFTFTTADGVQLNGWMLKPRDFDASKKYPVIMYQYSGPGSQEAADSWNIGFMGGGLFESYMADRGYIFVVVDGRGTGFRGADFEKCTYLRLGELESHDQAEAAAWLGTLPYVDKGRIGIWGWSFGGFNTLMSMSEGRGLFKAGVAVAAPTDWRFYDTVYTERYMRTPAENPGYDTNPIHRAAALRGKLLLIHGTADDNVHYRNCTEYSEALVQQGKQFDMQVYTNRNHFIWGGNTRLHLFERISTFFLENL